MAKTITIKLGDVEYSVPRLTIGQLKEVTKAFAGDKGEISFDILGISLRRADPKVEDINTIEADFPEIGEAVSKILIFSGLKTEAVPANPPGAGAEGG